MASTTMPPELAEFHAYLSARPTDFLRKLAEAVTIVGEGEPGLEDVSAPDLVTTILAAYTESLRERAFGAMAALLSKRPKVDPTTGHVSQRAWTAFVKRAVLVLNDEADKMGEVVTDDEATPLPKTPVRATTPGTPSREPTSTEVLAHLNKAIEAMEKRAEHREAALLARFEYFESRIGSGTSTVGGGGSAVSFPISPPLVPHLDHGARGVPPLLESSGGAWSLTSRRVTSDQLAIEAEIAKAPEADRDYLEWEQGFVAQFTIPRVGDGGGSRITRDPSMQS